MTRPLCRLSGAALLLFAASFGKAQTVDAEGGTPTPSLRPKIALTLSGGGAYGLLYLGALEWLEQHRIPIDGIAGNSGGALVGGWYATGIDLLTDAQVAHPVPRRGPDDMRLGGVAPILRRVDMESLFLFGPPFRNLPMPQKREAREYESELVDEFGHGVIRSPDGLVPGQNIQLLFDWITQAYPPAYLDAIPGSAPYDRLPTPFRCVATDMPSRDPSTWRKVVLGGPEGLPDAERPIGLARALRASMGIPLAFTPVYVRRKDGTEYRLVDGAAVDNFPTDVAIDAFHPDVLIGFEYKGIDRGDDRAAGLEGRLRAQGDRYHPSAGGREPGEKIIVTLDPQGWRFDSFGRWRELAWTGYQQMEALHRGPLGARLDRLALSPAAYQAYREARRARRRNVPIVPAKVTGDVDAAGGLDRVREAAVGHDLRNPDQAATLADALDRLVVDGGLATAGYLVENGTLDVRTTKRPYGPPFFRSGVTLEAVGGDRVWGQASARVSDLRTGRVGYWLDGSLGNNPLGRAGLEAPIARDLFLSPSVRLGREQEFQFDGDSRRSGVGISTAEATLALSYRPTTALEVAAGVAEGTNHADDPTGSPLDVETGGYTRTFLRTEFDTTDSGRVPRRGNHLWGELSDYSRLAGADHLTQFEGRAETFFSGPGRRNTLALQTGLGTSFGEHAPFPFEYRLGGFGSFAGYRRDEVRDSGYVSLRAAGFHEFGEIPYFLGRLYAVGSLQTVFTDGAARNALTLGALADTRLGNVYLGLAVVDHGAVRPMFTIGERF